LEKTVEQAEGEAGKALPDKDEVLRLFKLKLDITLGLKAESVKLLSMPKGPRLAREAEYFSAPMTADKLFLEGGVTEEELWDHMARVKPQDGFVDGYKAVMDEFKTKEAKIM